MPKKKSPKVEKNKGLPKVLVLNGPNLNLLGSREVGIYGLAPLREVESHLRHLAQELGVEASFFQSNHEGALVDQLQVARDSGYQVVVFNAGAYTHTSIALRDAIAAADVPVIEVHISNIHSREDFRRSSMIAPVCKGQISGFGAFSYDLGIHAAADMIRRKKRV